VGGGTDTLAWVTHLCAQGVRCPDSWGVLDFIAEKEKRVWHGAKQPGSKHCAARELPATGHAAAPRAPWAELQEVMSESFSSPELVGSFLPKPGQHQG